MPPPEEKKKVHITEQEWKGRETARRKKEERGKGERGKGLY